MATKINPNIQIQVERDECCYRLPSPNSFQGAIGNSNNHDGEHDNGNHHGGGHNHHDDDEDDTDDDSLSNGNTNSAPSTNLSSNAATSTDNILHGWLETVYVNGQSMQTRVLSAILPAEIVAVGAIPCACPLPSPIVIPGPAAPQKGFLVMMDKDGHIVYAVKTINANGSTSTEYTNADGSEYTGPLNELTLCNDRDYVITAPLLFCLDSTDAVTRSNMLDENGQLVRSIWQDARGNIIAEPTGALRAGSCELPITTEVEDWIDNLVENGEISGKYVRYFQVRLLSPNGSSVTNSPALYGGGSYSPIGVRSRQPLLPPVSHKSIRLTDGESWAANVNTQSSSFGIEWATPTDKVTAYGVEYTYPGPTGDGSVDGNDDPNIKSPGIQAIGNARCLVNYSWQNPLVDMSANPPVGIPGMLADDLGSQMDSLTADLTTASLSS
jgi:hypothetical protein